MKKLLLLTLPFMMMSCENITNQKTKLQANQTLCIVDYSICRYTQQTESLCYINSSFMIESVEGQIYYKATNDSLEIEIVCDKSFVIYHYNIYSWSVYEN